MYRQFLKTYVTRSRQLEINNESPETDRWCNFLCQKLLPLSDFHTKPAGSNICKKCKGKLVLAKKYVKEGKITKEEFKENPDILENFSVKKTIGDSKTMECVECKKTKKLLFFDVNRNVCKSCRKKQRDILINNRIREDINSLEEHKNNEKNLKAILARIPVNVIQQILKHYHITRNKNDKKTDSITKIILHFRSLRSPFMCRGNCGATLQNEFSYCNACTETPKSTVDERNLIFKQEISQFMEGRREITETDMYQLNTFCIRAIAEYLDIDTFRTKRKGDTKAKIVSIINQHLAEKYENEEKKIEAPSLVLNGMNLSYRDSDGYINATELCKAGGKRFNHWYSLDSTKDLIRVMEEENLKTGIPVFKIIDVTKGRYGGSWIHPDLAVQLAQWISPIFALQVSKWVRELALTGSVRLREEKTNDELLQIQHEYKRLKHNHTKLLEKRQYHKFKTGAVYYIISDLESGCIKYKPGFEGVDINVRLAQHRSSIPNLKLEFLIYASAIDCKLLEQAVLKRYSSRRYHTNHEWIYDLDISHIINSTSTLLDFLDIEYTIEMDLDKYNLENSQI